MKLRKGWTVRVFESVEAAEMADREENLRRTGVERIRLLTAISTPMLKDLNRDFQDLINC